MSRTAKGSGPVTGTISPIALPSSSKRRMASVRSSMKTGWKSWSPLPGSGTKKGSTAWARSSEVPP